MLGENRHAAIENSNELQLSRCRPTTARRR
jgi:hypothetical protein